MRWMDFDRSACVLITCFAASIPSTALAQSPATAKATPHILEANEGEQRVLRGWPGHPNPGESFALKVDPKNGGSSRLVLLTFDLGQGGEIAKHRHPNADEILFLQSGTAKVRLGDSVREIHSGATVF